MSEWLKEPASKTGVRQRTGGSNPSLTALCKANRNAALFVRHFCLSARPLRASSHKGVTGNKKQRRCVAVCFALGERGTSEGAARRNPSFFLPHVKCNCLATSHLTKVLPPKPEGSTLIILLIIKNLHFTPLLFSATVLH